MKTRIPYSIEEIKNSIKNVELQMQVKKELALESIHNNEQFEEEYFKLNDRRNILVGMLQEIFLEDLR